MYFSFLYWLFNTVVINELYEEAEDSLLWWFNEYVCAFEQACSGLWNITITCKGSSSGWLRLLKAQFDLIFGQICQKRAEEQWISGVFWFSLSFDMIQLRPYNWVGIIPQLSASPKNLNPRSSASIPHLVFVFLSSKIINELCCTVWLNTVFRASCYCFPVSSDYMNRTRI